MSYITLPRAGRIEKRADPVDPGFNFYKTSSNLEFQLPDVSPLYVNIKPGSILSRSSDYSRMQDGTFRDAVEDYEECIKKLIKMSDSLYMNLASLSCNSFLVWYDSFGDSI